MLDVPSTLLTGSRARRPIVRFRRPALTRTAQGRDPAAKALSPLGLASAVTAKLFATLVAAGCDR